MTDTQEPPPRKRASAPTIRRRSAEHDLLAVRLAAKVMVPVAVGT
jgi:hypothetical protein